MFYLVEFREPFMLNLKMILNMENLTKTHSIQSDIISISLLLMKMILSVVILQKTIAVGGRHPISP